MSYCVKNNAVTRDYDFLGQNLCKRILVDSLKDMRIHTYLIAFRRNGHESMGAAKINDMKGPLARHFGSVN